MSTLGFTRKNVIGLILAAAVAVSGFGVYQTQAAGHVDKDADVTITAVVDPTSDSSEFAQKYQGKLEIELYKIADLDTVGNPKVTEEFKDAGIDFSSLKTKASVEDTQNNVVDPAAEYVKANHDSLNPYKIKGQKTKDRFEVSTTIEKGAGIYLYYVNKKVQDEENTYIFKPAVFYAPTSDYVVSGQGSDEWKYNVTFAPKAEAKPRFGNLVIEKELTTFNASLGTAAYVFEVEAHDSDGKLVYSNVFTMNFNGAGSQPIVVKRIPAGSRVTVTEVYDGASYTYQCGGCAEVQRKVKVGDDIITVESGDVIIANKYIEFGFINDYDDRLIVGGVSVENHFKQETAKNDDDMVTSIDYKWTGNNLPKDSTGDN